MLRKILVYALAVPVAVILIAFVVANRHAVTVSLDPLSPEAPLLAVTMPLFLLLFVCVILGVLLGSAATWFAQGKWRKQARAGRREVERLKGETERLRREREDRGTLMLPDRSV